MGRLMFGKDEQISCLVDVDLRGKDGEALCLGHKTSTFFVGAGVYFSDDGYVLRTKGKDTFYALTPTELADLQREGDLPTPLPPYHVSWIDYAFGYSLWIILGGMAVVAAVKHVVGARRKALDDATPVSLGPPELRTKADRWLHEQAAPLLRFGETVQHQAYTLDNGPIVTIGDAAGATSTYVVLTSQRLLLFQARVGAFGPLLEIRGTAEIERDAVLGVERQERVIALHLADGSTRCFFVAPTGKLANQHAFLRDVPRLLGAQTAAASAA